jgi:hypothetical protein
VCVCVRVSLSFRELPHIGQKRLVTRTMHIRKHCGPVVPAHGLGKLGSDRKRGASARKQLVGWRRHSFCPEGPEHGPHLRSAQRKLHRCRAAARLQCHVAAPPSGGSSHRNVSNPPKAGGSVGHGVGRPFSLGAGSPFISSWSYTNTSSLSLTHTWRDTYTHTQRDTHTRTNTCFPIAR